MTELDVDGVPLLTYREAAHRVRRTPRAIRYWRQHGMVMGWAIRDGQRVRVVREDVLLAWWRQRLQNWPAHQYRMRQQLAERAALETLF
ncbi:hypothetical protein [Microbacterium sp. zg.Y909]|uniref:hypothetical protein n=1 Tax=Microbacterium sp. zg.Y909 TaxID=2969413 RepID=UPI00214C8C54|nr:hypothetical protein [Microbacterium sp. zg.Y909]MCR2824215.1 hypothetical protein [Microbacterium sp. zg.Y909]